MTPVNFSVGARMTDDRRWMRRTLELAARAGSDGEVPVGALIVKQGECIAEGWNSPIADHDPTAHAEIIALRRAAHHQGNYRLPGTTLYVTLEPCIMCAGAIIQARVENVVYGAPDPKAGAAGSRFEVLGTKRLNHQVRVTGDVLAEECAGILRAFFDRRRE